MWVSGARQPLATQHHLTMQSRALPAGAMAGDGSTHALPHRAQSAVADAMRAGVQRRQCGLALAAWAAEVAGTRHRRALLRTAIARRSRRAASSALAAWWLRTRTRKRLQRLLQLQVRRRSADVQSAALAGPHAALLHLRVWEAARPRMECPWLSSSIQRKELSCILCGFIVCMTPLQVLPPAVGQWSREPARL